jgi:integrase
MHAALERHVLPTFKDLRLEDITVPSIESWMDSLLDSGLSPKRVNNITSCLRVMLREAKRQGLLQHDPFDVIRPFADNCRERGVLSIDEVRKLFSDDAIATAWGGNLLYRTINMVAASTGMRQGEILAVRDEDVHDGWIHVEHSWNLHYGLQPTKTRQTRDVPVPPKVMEAMKPFLGSDGFVFSMTHGERPATGHRITKGLYAALERIGLSHEERTRRNINFHSFRHFFNSVMRARQIPVAVLQSVTGHTTLEMTDRYSHFSLDNFKEIVAVQAEVFA